MGDSFVLSYCFQTIFLKKIERSRANTCVIFIKTNRRLRTGIGDSNEHVKIFDHGINNYAEL